MNKLQVGLRAGTAAAWSAAGSFQLASENVALASLFYGLSILYIVFTVMAASVVHTREQ